jgi:hypothetical protein
MPRPPPLTREGVELNIAPLTEIAQQRIAEALGLFALPDHLADRIACMIATHRAGRKRSKGHGPARMAAALGRIESRLHRGHDGPEAVREITDPLFGSDDETFWRLAPIVTNPDVPLDRKIDAVAERRREVEALPEIDARYGLRVQLAANALAQIWYLYAVDRDDKVRQWEFVLAVLAAAGEITPGVAKNPKRLERLRNAVQGLLRVTAQPDGSA